MAVGKNKRLSKGKKGLKKKIVDAYARKEWYDIKAPMMFSKRSIGKTLVNRTQGLKNADEALRGRVLDLSLGDIHDKAEDASFRRFRLRIDEVQGRNCLTNVHGMYLASDKARSLVRKWQTLIEAFADVKTSDGYTLRTFVVAFTKRRKGQLGKTAYAQSAQVRAIRKRIFEVLSAQIGGSSFREVVSKLIPDSIAKEIERVCSPIYPLQNVAVLKMKIIKSPKYDVSKLLELHSAGASEEDISAVAGEDTGVPMNAEWSEPVPSDNI